MEPVSGYQGYSRKEIPEGGSGVEDGRRYIFLWVVGAESFQIIWVISTLGNVYVDLVVFTRIAGTP